MAKAKATIKGESEITAPEQARKVRKHKEKHVKDHVDSGEQSAMRRAETPTDKANNIKFANRAKRMEAEGENPVQTDGHSGMWKTGKKVAGHKTYQGDLTLKGVSQSGHEISCRVHSDTPKTEEELFYIFSKTHDSAVRAGFAIDASNKSDPMLATPYG